MKEETENDIGRDQRWSSTTIRAGITVTYGTGHTAYLWVWTAARRLPAPMPLTPAR